MSITDLEDFEGCGSLPNPTPPPTTNVQWYIKDGTWWLGDYNSGVQAEGEEGLSAYEVAVRNGFVGTEQEWVDGILAGYIHSLTTGNPHDTQIEDIPGLAEAIEQAGQVKTVNGINPDPETGNIELEFDDLSNKPTTASGYGITDVYTKTEVDANVVKKSGDTMTGTLTLVGGTTAIAPIKGQAGVLTTVPQPYAEEITSDGKYFTNGASERNALEEKPLIKNVTSTTYTALASDYNKYIMFSNANPIQVTIPASTFKACQSIKGKQGGLGQVEFVAGSGMTLLKAASDSLFTAEQNAVFEIFFESPTQAIIYGRLELA